QGRPAPWRCPPRSGSSRCPRRARWGGATAPPLLKPYSSGRGFRWIATLLFVAPAPPSTDVHAVELTQKALLRGSQQTELLHPGGIFRRLNPALSNPCTLMYRRDAKR